MATTLERIQLAQGTAALWTSQNPVLLVAEIGVETDTGRWKLGDGVTAWSSLVYQDTKYTPAVINTGTATMVAGTIAVTGKTSMTTGAVIRLAHKTMGGTAGALFISAKTAGTGFTIKSTSATDTSVVQYDVLSW